MAYLMAAAILACVCAPHVAWPQGTPGAIPDPATYEGSKQLQQEQDRQDQNFRQMQEQQSQDLQQQQLQKDQQRNTEAASGSGRADARLIWERRPLVPPDRNPLIGRWNTHAAPPIGAKTSPLGDVGSLFGADVARMASGMLQSVCDSMFGSGMVDFRPNALVSIEPGGGEKVLTRVEYRGGADRIAVLPVDGAFGVAVFGFDGRDRITAEEIGCAMARASNASLKSSPAPTPGAPAIAGASGIAVLSFATPLAGSNLLILRHNVNVALANGGLRAPPNGTPMKTWHLACQLRTPVCQQGMQALVADTVGTTKTDASGRAQTQPLLAGHYYVFGAVQIANRPMIWNLPVDLKAGTNSLTLDQHNVTPVE
jgi:hypothetical protein